jgi:hypothetical protein
LFLSDYWCIAGLLTTGYVTRSTLVWKDGLQSWQPLAEVPEIWTQLSALQSSQPGVNQDSLVVSTPHTDANATAEPAAQTGNRRSATVVKAAKPQLKAVDRELAAFQAEMSALGATSAPDQPAVDVADRAETPPPAERRFQDDDGTWFVWDGNLRRFVEEVRCRQTLACVLSKLFLGFHHFVSHSASVCCSSALFLWYLW